MSEAKQALFNELKHMDGMMFFLLIILGVFSWALTGLVRRYALDKNILDLPNHRSSHKTPTPRGGGVAFVILFFLAIPCLVGLKLIDFSNGFIWIIAAALIALLGFYDDKKPIGAKWRFVAQFAISIVALYSLGGMATIPLFSKTIYLGYFPQVFAVFYFVWLINLYNFMDGIDGLAAIEAITACLGATILFALSHHAELLSLPLVLVVVLLGFLYWNIAPARIFMGDVGSYFLGFILAVFSILASAVRPEFFWSWLILLGVFIVDATWTLFNRMLQGCKLYEAHRTHAYQQAISIFSGRHFPVMLGVGMINILWLWPLAILVGLQYLNAFIGLTVAYIPLIVLAVQFKAGRIYELCDHN